MNTPPCSKWRLWVGREIEGTYDLGEVTLFMRSFVHPNVISKMLGELGDREMANPTRLWICREVVQEYLAHQNMHLFMLLTTPLSLWGNLSKVCVESTLLAPFPNHLRERCPLPLSVYWKLPIGDMWPGDTLCVGKPYTEEYYTIGSGPSVTPDKYLDDIFLA